MKRVVMEGPGRSIVTEVPDIHAADNEILIRLRYMGICLSDKAAWATAEAGRCLGHEPMGEVVEVGAAVTGFQVGDRVSGLWAQGMNEYNAVDPGKEVVIKIPDNLRDEEAVIEPLACILSAASKARIEYPGQNVIVVGCGYMGCGAVSALKLRGARVIAVDISDKALANAARFGADECLHPEEALAKYGPYTDANGKSCFGGVPTVMEWGGNEKSLDTAICLTGLCGQLCVGGYHTGGKRSVDMQQLNVKAIDCLSVHPREEELLERCARSSVDLLSRGTWAFRGVPTMVYPADQFDRAYADMAGGQAPFMKALLDMRHVGGEPTLY